LVPPELPELLPDEEALPDDDALPDDEALPEDELIPDDDALPDDDPVPEDELPDDEVIPEEDDAEPDEDVTPDEEDDDEALPDDPPMVASIEASTVGRPRRQYLPPRGDVAQTSPEGQSALLLQSWKSPAGHDVSQVAVAPFPPKRPPMPPKLKQQTSPLGQLEDEVHESAAPWHWPAVVHFAAPPPPRPIWAQQTCVFASQVAVPHAMLPLLDPELPDDDPPIPELEAPEELETPDEPDETPEDPEAPDDPDAPLLDPLAPDEELESLVTSSDASLEASFEASLDASFAASFDASFEASCAASANASSDASSPPSPGMSGMSSSGLRAPQPPAVTKEAATKAARIESDTFERIRDTAGAVIVV
jgi:hypothetical protein